MRIVHQSVRIVFTNEAPIAHIVHWLRHYFRFYKQERLHQALNYRILAVIYNQRA